jgi:hypothetical protein
MPNIGNRQFCSGFAEKSTNNKKPALSGLALIIIIFVMLDACLEGSLVKQLILLLLFCALITGRFPPPKAIGSRKIVICSIKVQEVY